MTITRFAASAALAAALGLAVLVPPGTAGAATPTSLPQTASADAAANWLAGEFGGSGFIPSATDPTVANLSATANAVLALATAGVDIPTADAGLAYLEGQVNSFAGDVDGSYGPGQLALLILDAHALGVSTGAFGTPNLVTELLATEQTSGADAGLFGTETQLADYDAGTYNQGLVLAALAAIGDTAASAGETGTAVSRAVTWLTDQQCPDGGWALPDAALNACNGKASQYEGPDTNSTSLAVQGLEAQGALGSGAASSALLFIRKSQDSAGGWGYEPSSKTRTNDPDSTALVLQALLALGAAPSSATYTKSGVDGVASLGSFQLSSGAFAFSGDTPSQLSTYQAIPALAGVTFAYDLATPTVTAISPPKGRVTGGNKVRITGTGFAEAGSVLFGATAATSFTVTSGSSITAVVPAGHVGTVQVTVSSPVGTSSTTSASVYTYK
ncbi:MAG: IPT/TIG domain-containing protein [Acidimicrobiales bacterium]|jgi:hypothetical protein